MHAIYAVFEQTHGKNIMACATGEVSNQSESVQFHEFLVYMIPMLRRPAGRPSVAVHNTQTSSPKPLRQSELNFVWSLHG